MVALERMLGDKIYYYDDKDSFITQVKTILAAGVDMKRFRSLAERYDWKVLACRYEDVLKESI